jgi:nucleoid-associated protein YgaU
MAEGDTPPIDDKAKGKGSFLKKNKTAIIGASILLGVVMLYLLAHRSSAGATAGNDVAPSVASNGFDPTTGYPYGSAADLAASGSSGATTSVPGPAGATGPAGPPGPPGTPAKPAGHVPGPIVRPTPHPAPRTYRVEAGDNLSKIASKLHVAGGWQALYRTNKSVIGGNPNLIKPGQTLHY